MTFSRTAPPDDAPLDREDLPINAIKTCNIEFDATVFGFAQNKPTTTDVTADVTVSTALLAAT
jgi:hypothetical protein